MNRTQRMKSQMGKARASHNRRRSTRRHHQLLISEFLTDRSEGPGRGVFVPVIHRAAAPVNATQFEGSPIISRCTPLANPTITGVATVRRGLNPSFRWEAVLVGFAAGLIPGIGVLLLLSLLIH
ncbi:MAG: hypothetical protein JSV19_02775 [Phycisphaerales bacterium]|nr:MAG: hypothetical protein JSV19_02775 [Phycisphaerales bacterium]